MNKDGWLKLHGKYERRAFRIIQKHIRKQIKAIPVTDITEATAELTIATNIKEGFAADMLKEVYQAIGMQHGDRVGRELNAVKRYSKPLFSQEFLRVISLYLLTDGLEKVVTIEKTLIEDVKVFIVQQLADGKTIQQIASKMNAGIYKWQALRIARTETTFATSFAAEQAAQITGLVLQKEWIAADDSRTRPSHAAVDNVKVDKDDTFNVGGVRMKYPGDPNAPASEVINCRCTVAYVPKRDNQGNLIFL